MRAMTIDDPKDKLEATAREWERRLGVNNEDDEPKRNPRKEREYEEIRNSGCRNRR